ncbi:MAG: N-acetylmuramoyl-L-alanine amidase [Acidimicrobiales bacterium]
MRKAVAALFVLSILAAGVVMARDDAPAATAAAAVAVTTSSTVVVTTSTSTSTTTTTTVPAPTTTVPAPTTAPPVPAPVTGGSPKVLVSPAGVVVPVLGREGDAYRVETPCGRSAVVRGGTPVTDATVVLDAGHGGAEPGAVSPGGLPEKSVNLAVVSHARDALERAGKPTVLTRTADYRVPLTARARLVMVLRPKAFVSVHHNAEPDGPRPGPGSETYYQVASPESKRLAGLIYEEVVAALSAYDLAWVADTDAGAKYRRKTDGDDYYGILRRTQGVPAVLAELAFVSNPAEADLLSRPDVQKVEGEAVARGILRFLDTADGGSGFVEPYPRSSPAGGGGGSSGCVDPPL